MAIEIISSVNWRWMGPQLLMIQTKMVHKMPSSIGSKYWFWWVFLGSLIFRNAKSLPSFLCRWLHACLLVSAQNGSWNSIVPAHSPATSQKQEVAETLGQYQCKIYSTWLTWLEWTSKMGTSMNIFLSQRISALVGYMLMLTLPENKSSHLKMDGWNTSLLWGV